MFPVSTHHSEENKAPSHPPPSSAFWQTNSRTLLQQKAKKDWNWECKRGEGEPMEKRKYKGEKERKSRDKEKEVWEE